jgi:hypothetical protein
MGYCYVKKVPGTVVGTILLVDTSVKSTTRTLMNWTRPRESCPTIIQTLD